MRKPERKEREKRAEEIVEAIMSENFPKLARDIESQIQKAQRTWREI